MSPNSNSSRGFEPIPIPIEQRWREFRLRYLPLIVFVTALAAASFVWRYHVAAPTLQGEVERTVVTVSSPQVGIVRELKVGRFERVHKGDAVAVITLTDPSLPLAKIRSEMDLVRARLEPRLSHQRNATDFERLRLELLLQKVDLASAQVNLARAVNELKRNGELFESKLISEDLYDFYLKNKEQIETEVAGRTQLIADLELGLRRLETLGDLETADPIREVSSNLIQAHEEQLRSVTTNLSTVTLVAPIDGMVSTVFRQEGETIMNGDAILAISALGSDRIVGYLRQPFPMEPRAGMEVEVRSRSTRREVHLARILHVGAQLEPITNSLAMNRAGSLLDMGLPIAVNLPETLDARPGQVVDLVIRP